jgi:hypothetical protein
VPVFEEQTLAAERKHIRDRPELNKTLFENRDGLRWIYEARKGRLPDPYQQSTGFGISQATTLLRNIHPLLGVDPNSPETGELMQGCFLFSQMTIVDDAKHEKKYHHLHYVEFLDFLCRVALAFVHLQEPIEHRVMVLMEHLYDQEGIRTAA